MLKITDIRSDTQI